MRECIAPFSDEGQRKLKKLARKEYLRVELGKVRRNIATVEAALLKYAPVDPSQALVGMKRAYRLLNSTWFLSDDAGEMRTILNGEISKRIGTLGTCDFEKVPDSKILLHRSWVEAPYERNPYPFDDVEIFTCDGTRARSKAEAMIYECLKKYDVPFRFDPLITVISPEGIPFELAPDFAFEDANLEEFYWEFCGKMDDEKYVNRFKEKSSNYAKAGIVPWKNIIYSFSAGNDIDMGYIESVVCTQIIPRL